MTADFNILSDTDLDQVSGGWHIGPPSPPTTPGGHHWPMPKPEPQMSATSLFNNPDLYRWGTSTAKEF
jgi:bacteriocin-like protein